MKQEQKFLKIKENTKEVVERHLLLARNKLSIVILDNRHYAGRNNTTYTNICEAQNRIDLALKHLNSKNLKGGNVENGNLE